MNISNISFRQNYNFTNLQKNKQHNLISFKGSSSGVLNTFETKDGSLRIPVPNTLKQYENKENVTILGSSKTTPFLNPFIDNVKNTAFSLINKGYNVITGGGNDGIMGKAIIGAHSALQTSDNTVKGKNLSILTSPGWGDEDLEHTNPIVVADGEESRIKQFYNVSKNPNSAILVYPGSTGTLQEAITLISKNFYTPKDRSSLKIYLVGKKFFEPVKQMYKNIFDAGLSKWNPDNPNDPNKLFEIVNPQEVGSKFSSLDKHA